MRPVEASNPRVVCRVRVIRNFVTIVKRSSGGVNHWALAVFDRLRLLSGAGENARLVALTSNSWSLKMVVY